METYTTHLENGNVHEFGTNRVLGNIPETDDVTITFNGENNVVFFEKNIGIFRKSTITFDGDDSLVYISSTKSRVCFNAELSGGNTLFIGEKQYYNNGGALEIRLAENDSLFIGRNCLFSLDVTIDSMSRDGSTHGDIYIGDHVWLGHGVKIYGKTMMQNCSVAAAKTLLENVTVPPLSCYATRGGVTGELKKNVLFTKDSLKNAPPSAIPSFDEISQTEADELLYISKKESLGKYEKVKEREGPDRKISYLARTNNLTLGDIMHKLPNMGKPSFDDADQRGSGSGNKVIGNYEDLGKVKIKFKGNNNVLFVEDGAKLKKCRIVFSGDNSLVYIGKSDEPYSFTLLMHHATSAYIGRNCRFRGGTASERPAFSVSECTALIIDDEAVFEKNSWVRTSDQHPLYDASTRKRLNKAKSVIIGRGVTVEEGALILKGRHIYHDGESDGYKELMERTAEILEASENPDEMLEAVKSHSEV